MSRAYLVRIGCRRAPATGYADLLDSATRTQGDDGAMVLAGNHATAVCVDCSTGTLAWADGGHVPWHRICDHCGSHWDMHPVAYVVALRAADEPRDLPPSQRAQHAEVGAWCRGSRLQPIPHLDTAVSEQEGAPTHRQVLAAIGSEQIAEAGERARRATRGEIICIEAGWARRARFYGDDDDENTKEEENES